MICVLELRHRALDERKSPDGRSGRHSLAGERQAGALISKNENGTALFELVASDEAIIGIAEREGREGKVV
jgi:hypothetical protein